MKRFIAVFAAALVTLTIAAASAGATPVGKPFMRGMHSPAELASKVEASLANDPSGMSIIDSARCKADGSCARPIDYLEMFRISDRGAVATVGELPAFLRSLIVAKAPVGEYWLACLKHDGRAFAPHLHCISRFFHPGETVWVDPRTRHLILASDCTNPIEKPVRQACGEIHFFTRTPDTVVRFAILGPAPVDDECIGVKRAGETEFERWWYDECAEAGCDFSEDAAVVGQPVQLIGSYVPQPGEHVLRVPAWFAQVGTLYRTVLCLDEEARHSDGRGVRAFEYLHAKSGKPVATVWYSPAEVRKGFPPMYWTWGEEPTEQ